MSRARCEMEKAVLYASVKVEWLAKSVRAGSPLRMCDGSMGLRLLRWLASLVPLVHAMQQHGGRVRKVW